MKKCLMLSKEDFFLIVHACPNKQGVFQWYVLDDPNNSKKRKLKGQVYESITIGKEWLKKKGNGKWLACHCIVDGEEYDELCCKLFNSFEMLLLKNKFDTVSVCGEDGNIRDNYSIEQ